VRFLRHEEDKTWFEITIYEGRNQQIRRMGEASGFPVMRLARLSFAGINHEDLRPGQWRFITASELMDLRATASRSGPLGAAVTGSGARRAPGVQREPRQEEAPVLRRVPRTHADIPNDGRRTHGKAPLRSATTRDPPRRESLDRRRGRP
jgi:23S rRNA pseudouridine2605 synthase